MKTNFAPLMLGALPFVLLFGTTLTSRVRVETHTPAPIWEESLDDSPDLHRRVIPDVETRAKFSEVAYNYVRAYRSGGLDDALRFVQPAIHDLWREPGGMHDEIESDSAAIASSFRLRVGHASLIDPSHGRIAVIATDQAGRQLWFRITLGQAPSGPWRINSVTRTRESVDDVLSVRRSPAQEEPLAH